MIKKGKDNFIRHAAILQIILLISFSFAFSFIFNAGLGSAQELTESQIQEFLQLNPEAQRKVVQSEPKYAPFFGEDSPTVNSAALAATGSQLRVGAKEIIKNYGAIDKGKALIVNVGNKVVELNSLKSTVPPGGGEAIWEGITKSGETIKIPAGEASRLLESGAITELASGTGPYSYKLPFVGTEFTGVAAHLVQGLVWAGVVYGAARLVGPWIGLDDKNANVLGLAGAAGIMTYKGIKALQESNLGLGKTGILSKEGFIGKNAGLVGIGVAVAVFVLLYKKEKKKLVTFECLPWEPPIGGSSCEQCNKDSFRPCSEYRCKALGQACELLNPGTNEERCTWVNPRDVTSPTIQPWTDALKPIGELKYTPNNAIRPPNRGVKIVRTTGGTSEGCLQPFTPLEFGVIVNEPAQCKVDYDRNNSFEAMQFYFGERNLYAYNHTQRMRLPGVDTQRGGVNSSGSPILENDGTFNLFVRCQDANGNQNEDAFVFSFCVDPSPDTTPPIIEETSIVNNGAVRYNADSVPIEVYTNEPAECKWGRQDKSYDDLENEMTCNTESFQVNADLQYTCSGELTGIVNQQSNDFYFRCKDQPDKADNERNVNVQSYKLTLRGSQELNIIEVAPNETIKGSTETVPVTLKVKTDDGADEGDAICYFSISEDSDDFVAMFETNNFEHKQQLDLVGGEYTYFFRCVDAGGNTAESKTTFSVIVDKQAPSVTRAYKDLDALKIVTNEDAQCVYSLNNCNYVFSEGIAMLKVNPSIGDVHYAEWKPKNTYYVKCKDERGNEPSPNQCSIVVKGVEIL